MDLCGRPADQDLQNALEARKRQYIVSILEKFGIKSVEQKMGVEQHGAAERKRIECVTCGAF